jgi:hypothetical protein
VIRWVVLLLFVVSCNCGYYRTYKRIVGENAHLSCEVVKLRSDVNDLVRYKDAIVAGDIKIEGLITK